MRYKKTFSALKKHQDILLYQPRNPCMNISRLVILFIPKCNHHSKVQRRWRERHERSRMERFKSKFYNFNWSHETYCSSFPINAFRHRPSNKIMCVKMIPASVKLDSEETDRIDLGITYSNQPCMHALTDSIPFYSN